MTVQLGNTSRLNVVKGCSQLLEVDSSDTSLLNNGWTYTGKKKIK